MSWDELQFIYHYQSKVEKDFVDKIAITLGVLWDLDAMRESRKYQSSTDTPPDKVFIPLSVSFNPGIIQTVEEIAGIESDDGEKKGVKAKGKTLIGGGEYIPKSGEVIKSVASLSKDEFFSLIGKKRPKR